MEMKLDEAIDELESMIEAMEVYNTIAPTKERQNATRVLIDTMRKIQKIVERGNREELGYEYIGEKISEVVNDNN